MPKIKNSSREGFMQLPNGCYCSKPEVSPKNYKQLKKISGPWRIHYRFYDPAFTDVNGKVRPKQVKLMQMNAYKSLEERKHAATIQVEEEIQMLLSGFNPYHKKIIASRNNKYEIESTTLFIDALRSALRRVDAEEETKKDIGYVIDGCEKAAAHLGYSYMHISEVKRKHIIFLLDHLRDTNIRFTDNTFNHYRKYLRILFKELVKVEAVESNIITDIEIIAIEETDREVLSDQERQYVNDLLATNYPEFHRYLHIFFHSGGRIRELMKLKGSDVDLKKQAFKTTIKKGKKTRTVWRPIKNIAMKYWRQAMKGCGPDDYIFSEDLAPGAKMIRADQITKRWYRLIKKERVKVGKKWVYKDRVHIIGGKKVKITADFYALKHLNTTEVVDRLDEKAAAELNQHTSTAMVVKIYDKKQKDRQHEKIKKVNNPFA
jgi:integrase